MAFGQGHHCRIRQGLQRAARIITIHITVYGLVGRCKASVIPISIHQTFHAGTFQNSGKLTIFPVRIQIITNRLTLEHIITVTFHTVVITAGQHGCQNHTSYYLIIYVTFHITSIYS